uniref:Sulfotransferase domain-containing protein n=1 Tax=viral metagenome TaxID=1070528 RepID=A0A6C0CIJ4_9ZZZZ
MPPNQYISHIKLVFIHVPKTGGSFIEQNLKKLAEQYNEHRNMGSHYTINQYILNTQIPENFNEFIYFGVVRNPYDRIYSAYSMYVRNNWSGFNQITYKKLNKPNSFESFIKNLYELFKQNKLPWQNCENSHLDIVGSSSIDFSVHVAPQFVYFINHNNELALEKENILKYESLDKDLNAFLNNNYKDNVKVYDFFQTNIIKNVRIKQSYNIPTTYPHLSRMIQEIYEKDFVLFNYQK